MLCGYLGEKVGWGYGFGLAGIFMFFGMIQFWLSQRIFGNIGLKPNKDSKENEAISDGDKRNPFSPLAPIATHAIPKPSKIIPIPYLTLAIGLYLLSHHFENKGANEIINSEFNVENQHHIKKMV